MKSALLVTLSLFAGTLSVAQPGPVAFDYFEYTGRDTVFERPLPSGHFRNPILAGFYPDPSICRVGDDYYLIHSTFSYFPGIPIFHSKDLVDWTQIGHVIDRPEQLNYDGLGLTRGIFAPAISHHDGTFYVVCTMVGAGGNFLMTAKNPAGPWSDPIWLDFGGIDPSLFFDDDGRAWMVNNGNPPDNRPLYDGNRAIWIQEFDVAAQKMIGPRTIIVNGGVDLSTRPVWIEGPHLYKRDGWYYLCCAEGGTSVQHSQVILRGKSPTGPFEPWAENPILTQRDLDSTAPHAVTCTGHADLVEGPDGNWWAVFLACRPFAGEYWTTGRETFLLPVTWTEDGWPVILPKGERVPYVVKSPGAESRAVRPVLPLTGNFTWRDEFKEAELPLHWIMVRAPKETWWTIDAAAGRVALTPRADDLSGKGNPSFLARRVQHAKFDAETAFAIPEGEKASAGLVVLQSETNYFYAGARRTTGGVEVFLERADRGAPQIVATKKIPAGAKRAKVRLTGDEMRLRFSFAADEADDWQTLAQEVDALPITVQAAGGGLHFTGAVVGMFARADQD